MGELKCLAHRPIVAKIITVNIHFVLYMVLSIWHVPLISLTALLREVLLLLPGEETEAWRVSVSCLILVAELRFESKQIGSRTPLFKVNEQLHISDRDRTTATPVMRLITCISLDF